MPVMTTQIAPGQDTYPLHDQLTFEPFAPRYQNLQFRHPNRNDEDRPLPIFNDDEDVVVVGEEEEEDDVEIKKNDVEVGEEEDDEPGNKGKFLGRAARQQWTNK
ncbi:hypothetical protein L1987_70275 [Smallanthus sonchifolius]|uniref:Uncharacterized protein n=1 Tax=Smallanthus sonchifolius TaxID=185202 RepID=A0ACB9APE8_9ASTR|nr:hypothetical protein L1987_70275 [Smallanthus sonchifolius]